MLPTNVLVRTLALSLVPLLAGVLMPHNGVLLKNFFVAPRPVN